MSWKISAFARRKHVQAALLAALDLEHGMAIGHHPHRPPRRVGRTALPPRQQLRPGVAFPALAKRARRGRILEAHGLQEEVVRTFLRLEIDQHRTAGDRVAPELGGYHPGLNASL